MKLRGPVYKLRNIIDDINCNYILKEKYSFNPDNPARYLFEDSNQDFSSSVSRGDFLVAGHNFGIGCVREQVVDAFLSLGITVIIAKSFAYGFYRLATNSGILLIECNTDHIDDKDEVQIDLVNMFIRNITKKVGMKIEPVPPAVLRIYNDRGLLNHLRKNNWEYNL